MSLETNHLCILNLGLLLCRDRDGEEPITFQAQPPLWIPAILAPICNRRFVWVPSLFKGDPSLISTMGRTISSSTKDDPFIVIDGRYELVIYSVAAKEDSHWPLQYLYTTDSERLLNKDYVAVQPCADRSVFSNTFLPNDHLNDDEFAIEIVKRILSTNISSLPLLTAFYITIFNESPSPTLSYFDVCGLFCDKLISANLYVACSNGNHRSMAFLISFAILEHSSPLISSFEDRHNYIIPCLYSYRAYRPTQEFMDKSLQNSDRSLIQTRKYVTQTLFHEYVSFGIIDIPKVTKFTTKLQAIEFFTSYSEWLLIQFIQYPYWNDYFNLLPVLPGQMNLSFKDSLAKFYVSIGQCTHNHATRSAHHHPKYTIYDPTYARSTLIFSIKNMIFLQVSEKLTTDIYPLCRPLSLLYQKFGHLFGDETQLFSELIPLCGYLYEVTSNIPTFIKMEPKTNKGKEWGDKFERVLGFIHVWGQLTTFLIDIPHDYFIDFYEIRKYSVGWLQVNNNFNKVLFNKCSIITFYVATVAYYIPVIVQSYNSRQMERSPFFHFVKIRTKNIFVLCDEGSPTAGIEGLKNWCRKKNRDFVKDHGMTQAQLTVSSSDSMPSDDSSLESLFIPNGYISASVHTTDNVSVTSRRLASPTTTSNSQKTVESLSNKDAPAKLLLANSEEDDDQQNDGIEATHDDALNQSSMSKHEEDNLESDSTSELVNDATRKRQLSKKKVSIPKRPKEKKGIIPSSRDPTKSSLSQPQHGRKEVDVQRKESLGLQSAKDTPNLEHMTSNRSKHQKSIQRSRRSVPDNAVDRNNAKESGIVGVSKETYLPISSTSVKSNGKDVVEDLVIRKGKTKDNSKEPMKTAKNSTISNSKSGNSDFSSAIDNSNLEEDLELFTDDTSKLPTSIYDAPIEISSLLSIPETLFDLSNITKWMNLPELTFLSQPLIRDFLTGKIIDVFAGQATCFIGEKLDLTLHNTTTGEDIRIDSLTEEWFQVRSNSLLCRLIPTGYPKISKREEIKKSSRYEILDEYVKAAPQRFTLLPLAFQQLQNDLQTYFDTLCSQLDVKYKIHGGSIIFDTGDHGHYENCHRDYEYNEVEKIYSTHLPITIIYPVEDNCHIVFQPREQGELGSVVGLEIPIPKFHPLIFHSKTWHCGGRYTVGIRGNCGSFQFYGTPDTLVTSTQSILPSIDRHGSSDFVNCPVQMVHRIDPNALDETWSKIAFAHTRTCNMMDWAHVISKAIIMSTMLYDFLSIAVPLSKEEFDSDVVNDKLSYTLAAKGMYTSYVHQILQMLIHKYQHTKRLKMLDAVDGEIKAKFEHNVSEWEYKQNQIIQQKFFEEKILNKRNNN